MELTPFSFKPDQQLSFGRFTGTQMPVEQDGVTRYLFQIDSSHNAIVETAAIPSGMLYRLSNQGNPSPEWEAYIGEYTKVASLRRPRSFEHNWLHSNEINADEFFRETFENIAANTYFDLSKTNFGDTSEHPFLPDLDQKRKGMLMIEIQAQFNCAIFKEMWTEALPDLRWVKRKKAEALTLALFNLGVADGHAFGFLHTDIVVTGRQFRNILTDKLQMNMSDVAEIARTMEMPSGMREIVLKE